VVILGQYCVLQFINTDTKHYWNHVVDRDKGAGILLDTVATEAWRQAGKV